MGLRLKPTLLEWMGRELLAAALGDQHLLFELDRLAAPCGCGKRLNAHHHVLLQNTVIALFVPVLRIADAGYSSHNPTPCMATP